MSVSFLDLVIQTLKRMKEFRRTEGMHACMYKIKIPRIQRMEGRKVSV